jgi:PKHD-type hydroxylase
VKVIKGVFSAQDLAAVRALIPRGRLQEGAETAFGLARAAKANQQFVFEQSDAQALAEMTFAALKRSTLFHRCALPVEASMPMINRYAPGMCYGPHYDTSLMACPNGSEMRTDLSATLFISDPADYDGGELCLEMDGALQKVKLAAGDLLLYPAGVLHNVAPVTRGVRHAVVFWVQSRIREHDRRQMLFRLDESIGALAHRHPECAEVRDLLGVFQNLTRMWMT